MQFITTGNRIAVENFVLGDLYTITFTNGTYINSACIGIGENFVSFQRNEPELLFTLTMDTAELVSSIDLYQGGSGTNNYNDLTNKPQINDVELVGNKSLSDLGIQATISDIDTIRSGAAAGATAVQPAALADYQPKIDSSNKLDADLVDDTSSTNKFATAAQLSQIETNKNNILTLAAEQARNKLKYTIDTLKAINTTGVWNDNTYSINMIDFTINDDMSISVSGNVFDTNTVFLLNQNIDISPYNTDILSGCPVGGGDNLYAIRIAQAVSPWATMAADTGESTTIVNTSTNCNVYISIRNITNTLQFKPMICSASNWELTHTYQPYTPTNRELYDLIMSYHSTL